MSTLTLSAYMAKRGSHSPNYGTRAGPVRETSDWYKDFEVSECPACGRRLTRIAMQPGRVHLDGRTDLAREVLCSG